MQQHVNLHAAQIIAAAFEAGKTTDMVLVPDRTRKIGVFAHVQLVQGGDGRFRLVYFWQHGGQSVQYGPYFEPGTTANDVQRLVLDELNSH